MHALVETCPGKVVRPLGSPRVSFLMIAVGSRMSFGIVRTVYKKVATALRYLSIISDSFAILEIPEEIANNLRK
jgi:hypothetical protein